MKSLFPFRLVGAAPDEADSTPVLVAVPVAESEEEGVGTNLLKTAAWVSAGVGALAIGLMVGREIRQRYKFKRRTPYDFYAHSGDEQEMEFGVGI